MRTYQNKKEGSKEQTQERAKEKTVKGTGRKERRIIAKTPNTGANTGKMEKRNEIRDRHSSDYVMTSS